MSRNAAPASFRGRDNCLKAIRLEGSEESTVTAHEPRDTSRSFCVAVWKAVIQVPFWLL